MNDQAQALRNRIQKKETKIITVTSGKGGVGKSNFTSNIAIALKQQGKSPFILDADFGLANIEIILGARPKYSLANLIDHSCTMNELITYSPQEIPFISGGSGVKQMLFLEEEQITTIADELQKLEEMADVILIDTGAGINESILKFSQMADEVYVIVTPEPASITDAYALIKTLIKDFKMHPTIKLIINKADSKEEANDVYKKMVYVCQQFLKIQVGYGGYVPKDETVFDAVKKQEPVVSYAPNAKASQAYRGIAAQITGAPAAKGTNWISRFKTLFTR